MTEEQSWKTDVADTKATLKLPWKSRQIDQWNRMKSPETDPHKYSHRIFDKEAKEMQ